MPSFGVWRYLVKHDDGVKEIDVDAYEALPGFSEDNFDPWVKRSSMSQQSREALNRVVINRTKKEKKFVKKFKDNKTLMTS